MQIIPLMLLMVPIYSMSLKDIIYKTLHIQ